MIIEGVTSGVLSFLWCRVLTAPGMVFNFIPRIFYNWGFRLFRAGRWTGWAAKPLFDCPVCNVFWLQTLLCIIGLADFDLTGYAAALFSAFILDHHYGNTN